MTAVLTPVYGDVLLLIDFCLELVLLLAAGRLAGAAAPRLRLAAAALAGALYSLGFLVLSGSPLYHPAARLAAGAVVAGLAYLPLPLPHFARLVGWFYALSALAAGAALGFSWVTGGGPAGRGAAGWWPLGLAAGLVLLLGRQGLGWRAPLARAGAVVPVTVRVGDRAETVWGFIDTGHRLRDPVTGGPVVLAEAGALAGLLPGALVSGAARGAAALAELPPAWQVRARLLPCRTAVGEGLLLGFRPDRVEVSSGKERRTWRGVTVALTGERLSASGRYRALVPPVLSERGGGDGDGLEEASRNPAANGRDVSRA